MSRPNSNTQYHWNEQRQLYLEQAWNGSQWVVTWMPVGFRPPAQQPDPPRTPHGQAYTDSAYGSSPLYGSSSAYGSPPAYGQSPYTTRGQDGGSHAATSAATYSTPQTTYNYNTQPLGQQLRPRGSSSGSADQVIHLPRGKGAEVQGNYNDKLGNAPGNSRYEKVDPSYCVRNRKFFNEGRVFAVILTEEAGSTATSYNKCLSEARFSGHIVFTQIRRFVVVRCKREFCYACPIFTYSKRATLKRGVRAAEHGIAYSYGQQPKLLPGETGIIKSSLAVSMAQGEPILDIASRIYYGIHHPIQYNVKVKDIGQVLPNHVPALIGNWKAEDDRETMQAFDVTETAEDPELPDVPEETVPQSPTSHEDLHLYHPQNNVYGYDAKIAPHMYHPKHNPYGYHPKNNTHGYHPESNQCSYHPRYNPYGYHPQKAPFCYHPQFSPFGYHGELNVHGYHPDVTAFNFHPQSNPMGYHPAHNVYGYHPDKNPHGYHQQHHPYGYHPTLYPDNYHPTWKPQGLYYRHTSSTVVATPSENATTESDEEEAEYEDEEDGGEEDREGSEEEDLALVR